MNKDLQILLQQNKEKVTSSIHLVEASLLRVKDLNTENIMSPLELEPFDALCDRFVRSVEVCIQYFKSYAKMQEAIIPESYRDLLLKMEKWNIISDMPVWFEMRDIRNRVVHDYLPEHRMKIYKDIIEKFSKELILTKSNIENI